MKNKVNTFADLGQLLNIDKNLSNECKRDIAYLRTRHRHTQALENELIALHKAGTPPNMNEFGCTEQTGKDLLDQAEALYKQGRSLSQEMQADCMQQQKSKLEQ